MRIVGLTGGIGSGKSTVSALFEKLGVPVIDADLVARQVVEPGQPALAEIEAAFGPGVIDATGRLDRAALRRIVFGDDEARQRLEAILHPRILAEMKRRAGALDAPYLIFAIPLLIEAGQQGEVDRVLVVDASDAIRRRRVMERDGLSEAEVAAVMAAQASREARLAAADDVIVNEGDAENLARAVADLHRRYLELAGAAA